jgi:hypothetical protein
MKRYLYLPMIKYYKRINSVNRGHIKISKSIGYINTGNRQFKEESVLFRFIISLFI